METNQLKLYSISAAAKILAIGKDALYQLVANGKLGYIEVGKRKKIPYQELVRFQSEEVVRDKTATEAPVLPYEKIFNGSFRKDRNEAINYNKILTNILNK